jgi:hypothetical protein
MVWQDIVMMIANSIFVISLLPQVNHGFIEKKGFIKLTTSGPTFIGLFAVAISLYTLSLFLSALTAGIAGTLWLIIFIQRLMYSKA